MATSSIHCEFAWLFLLTFSVKLILQKKMRENDFTENFALFSYFFRETNGLINFSFPFQNFYFLPTRYRVLYDNCISLVYDVYSSHVSFLFFILWKKVRILIRIMILGTTWTLWWLWWWWYINSMNVFTQKYNCNLCYYQIFNYAVKFYQ